MSHRPDFVSEQDIEDADDILFAHPARRVSRWVCGCGEDYPCPEVRFALLVKGLTNRAEPSTRAKWAPPACWLP